MWDERAARDPPERGASTTVGVIVVAMVTVLLAGLLGGFVFDVSAVLPDSEPRFYTEIEPVDSGLELTPNVIEGPVDVVVNGETITTLTPEDGYEVIPLPVAPGDRVHFVADLGQHRVTMQERTGGPTLADFVAYYTFERGSGSTLTDRSENDNDATVSGASWTRDDDRTALAFDGGSDYARADQLATEGAAATDRFTVAVKYRVDADTGSAQRIVAHESADSNAQWHLTTNAGGGTYSLTYSVSPDGGSQEAVTADPVPPDEVHVAVGVYDGAEMRLYVDGEFVGSKTTAGGIGLGELVVGADVSTSSKNLDGRVYQLRLYHTAFDEEEVSMLTTLMEAEAE